MRKRFQVGEDGKKPFAVLILIARPAAGKSEIIDYLQKIDLETRWARFHMSELDVIDDFPMLWAWFEEDDILSRMGKPRLHSDEEGYFKHPHLWHVLIERLSLEYGKRLRDRPDYHNHVTTVIEFSRGIEHGGYREAFPHLSDDILRQAAIVYVNVSFAESFRKNRRRFNPDRPDSILEHALPDHKLERLYREDDWEKFSAPDPEFVTVKEIRVPYVIFENEDDVTTARGEALGRRLEEALEKLWMLKKEKMMIRVSCFKCRQRFTLDEGFVAVELAKLDNPHPRFFTAHCPRCRQAIKISLKGVKLPEVPPSAAGEHVEEEKAKAEEPEEKEAVEAPAKE